MADMHACVEHPAAPEAIVVDVLCITLGGERKRLIEQMVSELNGEATFACTKIRLRFCEGVDARCGFKDPGSLEQLAGDVLDAIGYSHEAATSVASIARRLGPDQVGVLGCCLAQLRALRMATVEGQADIIIEDSCRFRRDRGGVAQLTDAVLWQRANTADLLYYGWQGHHDNLDTVHTTCVSSSLPTVGLGRGVNQAGKPCDLIFCTYAYAASRRFYERLCKDLFANPDLFFRRKRGPARASPVDRLLLWRAAEASLQTRTCTEPCCFRAPLLPSCIHRQWEGPALETTLYQMQMIGLPWEALWLSAEEADAPAALARRREEEAAQQKQKRYVKWQREWLKWREGLEAKGQWRGGRDNQEATRNVVTEASDFSCIGMT